LKWYVYQDEKQVKKWGKKAEGILPKEKFAKVQKYCKDMGVPQLEGALIPTEWDGLCDCPGK